VIEMVDVAAVVAVAAIVVIDGGLRKDWTRVGAVRAAAQSGSE